MFSTYKLMSQVLVTENKKFTNEELAVRYQETHNPTVLAEVFCRNFPQWLHITTKPVFFRLDEEERASIVLEKLNKALETFDITKNYKFTTYANKLILMEMVNKNNKFNHNKRKDFICVGLTDVFSNIDAEEECHGGKEFYTNFVEQTQYTEAEYDLIDLKESINNSDLTDKEKLMCYIILDNPGINDIEIANIMKIHRHTVRNIKTKLKNKLSLAYTY